MNATYPKYLDWLRYVSAFLLFTYGVSKLAGVQFSLPGEIARRPVGSLSGFELTWFFYSYSRVYAAILGLTQIAGGALLLFRKTTTLGAAMMLPVMINILLINLIYVIAGGALLTSTFILASLLALLWHEHRSLVEVFWSRQLAEPVHARSVHRWIRTLILLLVLAEAVLVWIRRGAKLSL